MPCYLSLRILVSTTGGVTKTGGAVEGGTWLFVLVGGRAGFPPMPLLPTTLDTTSIAAPAPALSAFSAVDTRRY